MADAPTTAGPEALAQALAARPEDRALRGRLAERLDRLGRHDEALAVLEVGLAASPGAADLLILRLLTLRHAGRLSAATAALEALAARHPNHARLPELRGILAEAEGDVAAALRLFADDAAAHPGDPVRRLRWARALQRHHAPEDALDALAPGLALAPDHPELLAEQASLLARTGRRVAAEAAGDHAAAARHAAAALAADPGDGALRARLAERLDRLGRHDEALDRLEEGLRLAPAAAELLVLRMLTLRHAGRIAASAEALAALEAHHPVHPRLPELRGILAEAMGDARAALRLWEADAAAHPQDLPRRLRWARALARAGAPAAALAALAPAPDSPALLAERAALLRQLGRLGEAEDAIARLAARAPFHPALPTLRAEMAQAEGDAEAAIGIRAADLTAHPGDPERRRRLATALREAGRVAEALSVLDAAPAPGEREGRAACLFELGRWSCVDRMLEAWPEATGRGLDPGRVRVRMQLASYRHDHRAALRDAEALLAECGGAGPAAMAVAREAVLAFDAQRAWEALRHVPTRPVDGGPLRPATIRFRSLLGHLANELCLRPAETAALGEAAREDGREQARRAAALLRDAEAPGTLGPALALLIGLARAEPRTREAAAAHGPEGAAEAWPRAAAAGHAGPPIPRLLHHFWDAPSPPPDVARLMDIAGRMAPGHACRRWDERSARGLLAGLDAPEVLRAYRQAPHAAMRADILRLAALHEEGGVFLDADDLCAAPVTTLLPPGAGLVLHQEEYGSVGNNFLAATPRHPLVREALEQAAEAVLRGGSEAIWLATGPGLLTRVLARRLAQDPALAWPEDVRLVPLWAFRRVVQAGRRVAYKAGPRHWMRSVAA